jgi:uncharacterized membrane protein
VAIPLVAIAALMAPMVLTSRSFGIDWSGHLWLVSMQARNIEALGHPSLFIQSGLGAFYAWFAFYGATLYSIAGGLSALSGGHTTVAYIACFALAFTMSYGGFWWIASQAGIDGWRAHVVPLLFVTSAYFLTDAYARGAWPETMAVSTIPLVAASGGSLLRGARLRSWVALVFLASATLLTGSHNITLLLSSIFFVALVIVALVAGVDLRSLPWRRVLAVAGLFAVGVAINMWFLLPDLAYGMRTYVGAHPNYPDMPNLSLDLVLNPLRDSLLGTSSQLGPTPTFDTQLPTLALVWALVSLWLSRRQLGRTARRLVAGLGVLLVLIVTLVVWPGIWPHLPKLLWQIQFPYRLLTYATFCVLGLVLIALRNLSTVRSRRVLLGLLAAIVVVESAQGLHQIWATPSALESRSQSFTLGPSWWQRFGGEGEGVFGDQFSDFSGREVKPTITSMKLQIPLLGPVKEGYAVSFVSPGPGTIETNVQTGDYLVSVGGAQPAGRVEDGSLVVREDVPKGKPARVTFYPSRTFPVLVGKYLTLAGLVGALLLVLWVATGFAGWSLRATRPSRRGRPA